MGTGLLVAAAGGAVGYGLAYLKWASQDTESGEPGDSIAEVFGRVSLYVGVGTAVGYGFGVPIGVQAVGDTDRQTAPYWAPLLGSVTGVMTMIALGRISL